jgi:murein L,D-transpeptidase YcbB/YkuD
MNSGREQWVKLLHPVSVSLSYYTAWVDEEDLLQLRRDIYGLDKKLINNVASR